MDAGIILLFTGSVLLICSFWGLGFLYMPWLYTMLMGIFFLGLGAIFFIQRKILSLLYPVPKETSPGTAISGKTGLPSDKAIEK